MKYLLVVLSGSLLLFSCASNDAKSTTASNNDSVNYENMVKAGNDTTNFTSIQWVDSIHQDLGKIQEGQIVEISWKFKNTGDKPLIITNASASCGCTVAERPEEPVAPGAEGVIKAKFDSHDRVGPQHKDVYVESNTKGSRTSQLSFAVEVLKK